jgi:hypothetical protein
MKTLAVIANCAVIMAMTVIYMNHVHAQAVDQLITQIQIERVVAQALINP